MAKNTEKELRQEIYNQLQRVNKTNAPNIYAQIQTPDGYVAIEKRIIAMVISDKITPSACIPQIENEL